MTYAFLASLRLHPLGLVLVLYCVVGRFSDKPQAVPCFLRIPCPLGLVGCGARLCVILLYELGEENQTVQELQLPIKGQEKESTVPSAAYGARDCLCQHDAGSKGKGRPKETGNWKREKSEDKLETEKEKLGKRRRVKRRRGGRAGRRCLWRSDLLRGCHL